MAKTHAFRALLSGLSVGLAVSGASFAQSMPVAPPPGFSGDQYVDAGGCVFVRVGSGAAAFWMPRVGRDRQPVCGLAPSGVDGRIANAPISDERVAAREVSRPAHAAVGTRNPPSRVAHPGLTCATLAPGQRCGILVASPEGGASRGTPRSYALNAPPPGYREAWDDGRLNPYRGLGTASGQQQMQQVWTDTVPRRAVRVVIGADTIPSQRALTETRATRTVAPEIGEAAPASNAVRVGAGHRHLLAGTYPGQAEARAAHERLATAGFPAILGQMQRRGETVFVVMAGPYGDAQSLGRSVLRARMSGFPDATTRN